MPDPVVHQHQPAIVLASSSPRRRVLLSQLGVQFTVRITDFDETMTAPAAPETYVESLARQKAGIVAWESSSDATEGEAVRARSLVLGSDTVVSVDGEILGKPASEAEATAMLTRLRGRDHEVLTAVALIDTGDGSTRSRVVTTTVHMRDFDDAALTAYVASGEPMDKAGGYGIQRGTRQLIAGFTGCYTNVVGFPLCEVATLLLEAGVEIPGLPPYCRLPDGQPCPHEQAMAGGQSGSVPASRP